MNLIDIKEAMKDWIRSKAGPYRQVYFERAPDDNLPSPYLIVVGLGESTESFFNGSDDYSGTVSFRYLGDADQDDDVLLGFAEEMREDIDFKKFPVTGGSDGQLDFVERGKIDRDHRSTLITETWRFTGSL
jgi:hypothetical protein